MMYVTSITIELVIMLLSDKSDVTECTNVARIFDIDTQHFESSAMTSCRAYKSSVNLWYWYATFSKFCHDVMSYSVMYNQVGKVNVNYILDPELYVLKDFELVAVFAMKIWFKTCISICQIETCAENHTQLKGWKFTVLMKSLIWHLTEYIGWIYWVNWVNVL